MKRRNDYGILQNRCTSAINKYNHSFGTQKPDMCAQTSWACSSARLNLNRELSVVPRKSIWLLTRWSGVRNMQYAHHESTHGENPHRPVSIMSDSGTQIKVVP